MTTPNNQPPLEASRFNTQRVDLTPYIQQMEFDTFTIAPSLSSSILKKLTEGILHLPQTAMNKMWDDLKIERNARVAFITRIIMERIRDKFKSLESALEARLRHRSAQEQIPRLSTIFLDELSAVAQNKYTDSDEIRQVRTQLSVRRLHDIVLFGGRFGMWESRQGLYTPQMFIFRGFNTATSFLTGFYQLLVKTYVMNDIPLTKENIEKGIQSALQHMHLFASFNISHGPGLMDGLQDHTLDMFEKFNEYYFNFDKEKMRFAPRMERIREIRRPLNSQKVLEFKPEGPTTGCPVSFTPTDFDALATVYAKLLGTYVETMTDNEKENLDKSVRNFLASIS